MNLYLYLSYIIVFSVLIVLCILIAVAYFTLLDRKIMAAMQRRRGPNIVGFWGLLQPLADGLKLFLKEAIVPFNANNILFLLAPLLTFIISLLSWSLFPFTNFGSLVDLDTGVLFLFAISSLGVYGVILSGWASNSRYAFLGALRSTAQMISYEVSIGFIIISVLLCVGSTNLYQIIWQQQSFWFWHCWYLWPQVYLFFFSSVAETNRAPFDLAEAEAELVAGYFVEYSSMTFAFFFLGEYSSILVMCALISLFFFGGWFSPIYMMEGYFWFGIKIVIISFLFVWIRATFPRFTYVKLMQLGWKTFLPLSMALVILCSSILLAFDGLPNDLVFI